RRVFKHANGESGHVCVDRFKLPRPAKSIPERIASLEADLKVPMQDEDQESDAHAATLRRIGSEARTILEDLVEETVLGGVVGRWSEEVHTTRLKYVHVTDDVYEDIYKAMKVFGSYAHSNSPSLERAPPSIGQLELKLTWL